MLKPRRTVMVSWLGVAASLFLCAAELPAADARISDGEARAQASNCFSCHAIDHTLAGPAFDEVAGRYAGQRGAIVATLVKKIRMGGAGNWGEVPMTAHPELSDADITSMVKWILSLKPAVASAPASTAHSATAMNTYEDVFGKRVHTDVTVFTSADQKNVTPSILNGYKQYNAYCFRCHGRDAVGGGYAPDLRRSMALGMTYEQFLGTAMTGRPDKGMPSWAGVLEEKDIRAIYGYIRARQLDLIPGGRPPSG